MGGEEPKVSPEENQLANPPLPRKAGWRTAGFMAQVKKITIYLGGGLGANSYLRLNEALDTPSAKHIPKHLLFLRDFTEHVPVLQRRELQISRCELSNSLFLREV